VRSSVVVGPGGVRVVLNRSAIVPARDVLPVIKLS
jgi:hypothetical protein